MLKWKWLGLETKRCNNSAQIVGYVMNVSLFSAISHTLSLLSLSVSNLHFALFRLPQSHFKKRCNSSLSFSLSHTSYPSVSLSQCLLLLFHIFSSCYSNVLNNCATEIFQFSRFFHLPPMSPCLLLFLFSFHLSVPKYVMSAALLQLIQQYIEENTQSYCT